MSGLRRGMLAVLFAVLVLSATPAQAGTPPPTTVQARDAVRMVFTQYAELVEQRLVVSRACPRVGKHSRVCIARFVGPDGLRYRVTVTRTEFTYYLRARILPRAGEQ